MPKADEKKKETEDDAVDANNLKECCTAKFLLKNLDAASDIDEMIRLITEHRMRMHLQQQCEESAFYAREEEAERNESPEEDVLRARFHFLNKLLEFEARKCKLDVALAALRVMKKGETPFYQPESFGECPFCLDEMFEIVTTMRCISKPVAVHYPCCDNSLCYRCCRDLNGKVNEEREQALQEHLLLGARALDLNKKHSTKIKNMLKCPFCRAPVAWTERDLTEEHRGCANRTGDTTAQFEYGRRLLLGIGVKASPSEGKKWMVKAANGGDSRAKMFLAEENLNGWAPGELLPPKAKEYWNDVASIGHPEGQFVLAAEETWASNSGLEDIGLKEISKEAYDLLLLAAWQLSTNATSLLFSCFATNLLRSKGNEVDRAHAQARLVFWTGRQTKYCSPFPGYHDVLQNYGEEILMGIMHRHTLPRALYWARRELMEAMQRNNEPLAHNLECHAGLNTKMVKASIQQMEHLICSRCANCDQKASKKLHLNFCNR